MKKNVTYVDACHFEKIIKESGCEVRVQAGFVQVKAPNGNRLYVGKTKRVGRVDISGWMSTDPGVLDLGDDSFGAVHQQLDFSRTESEILESFRSILEEMKDATSLPVAKRTGTKSDAVGWTIA